MLWNLSGPTRCYSEGGISIAAILSTYNVATDNKLFKS